MFATISSAVYQLMQKVKVLLKPDYIFQSCCKNKSDSDIFLSDTDIVKMA